MREILFRGKRKDNGEWIYGDLLQDKDLEEYLIEYYDSYTDENGLHRDYYRRKIIPETVGQFTGLTSNGTKIFEGDIVKTDRFSKSNRLYIVKYDLRFSAFICQDKDNLYFVPFDGDSDQFEVIGNIHDNSELLEGGESDA